VGSGPLASILGPWSRLPRGARIGIGAAAILGAAGYALANGPLADRTDSVLFANLPQEDAGRVVESLKTRRIPYRIGGDGTEIRVPADQVHEARLGLAAEGLPSGGGVGFEIFDRQDFAQSDFQEQVKYHRAIEGELSRTLSHVTGVARARVHIVLPERSLFVREDDPASASVALTLEPGAQLADRQVRGIVHLVSSSVRALTPEHVTVVDQNGATLWAGANDADEEATDVLAFRRSVEQSTERKVQDLLDRAIGPGTTAVRVAAEVDFSREERTQEEFAAPTESVTRSYQITEEGAGGRSATPQGVPGAVSNLPGGDAPGSAGAGASGLHRRTETRNFEISKITRHAVEPVGRVERLSVAVAVDGRWRTKGKNREFVARTPGELARIQGIVSSAAGLDPTRGDSIRVEGMRFPHPHRPRDLRPTPVARVRDGLLSNAPALVGAFAALFLALGLRSALKRGMRAAAASPVALPATVRQIAAAQAASPAFAGAPAPPGLPSAATTARAIASQADPQVGASVVRNWLQGST